MAVDPSKLKGLVRKLEKLEEDSFSSFATCAIELLDALPASPPTVAEAVAPTTTPPAYALQLAAIVGHAHAQALDEYTLMMACLPAEWQGLAHAIKPFIQEHGHNPTPAQAAATPASGTGSGDGSTASGGAASETPKATPVKFNDTDITFLLQSVSKHALLEVLRWHVHRALISAACTVGLQPRLPTEHTDQDLAATTVMFPDMLPLSPADTAAESFDVIPLPPVPTMLPAPPAFMGSAGDSDEATPSEAAPGGKGGSQAGVHFHAMLGDVEEACASMCHGLFASATARYLLVPELDAIPEPDEDDAGDKKSLLGQLRTQLLGTTPPTGIVTSTWAELALCMPSTLPGSDAADSVQGCIDGDALARTLAREICTYFASASPLTAAASCRVMWSDIFAFPIVLLAGPAPDAEEVQELLRAARDHFPGSGFPDVQVHHKATRQLLHSVLPDFERDAQDHLQAISAASTAASHSALGFMLSLLVARIRALQGGVSPIVPVPQMPFPPALGKHPDGGAAMAEDVVASGLLSSVKDISAVVEETRQHVEQVLRSSRVVRKVPKRELAKHFKLAVVGSSGNGFSTSSSDVDLCLMGSIRGNPAVCTGASLPPAIPCYITASHAPLFAATG